MNAGLAVVSILLGLYDRVAKLLEGGTSADVVQASLELGLDTAAVVARERIAARAGAPVAAASVLAHRCADLARAFRAGGFEANAKIVEQLGDSLRRDVRSEDDTARHDLPSSSR